MRRLEKTIREIGWTHAVPRLAVSDRVSRAFDEMSREVHDCVLVMRDDKLAGIFTSRDFLNRIAAVRADPEAIVLGDVMTNHHEQDYFSQTSRNKEHFRTRKSKY